ncbi:hypothetical protein GCM10007079_05400 [Nocardiopsis terrae]|uniref:Uncharacterized protein n=1 Tax=Nocardiopsis terrae TaxID=372655 RepID=A0ABR9HNL9_9ACTN|nr:hypothetical protein [Nocardiopsis terrae]MBE1460589.1 hypothetical protein [Nocardiopsis terrae]GHC72289.1 hypothetical protein GCM10007079_05400 [Nocardiopsis terrae]
MPFDKPPRPWYLALSVLLTLTGAVLLWLDSDVLVPSQIWVLTLVWATNMVGCLVLYALNRVRSRSRQANSISKSEPAE